MGPIVAQMDKEGSTQYFFIRGVSCPLHKIYLVLDIERIPNMFQCLFSLDFSQFSVLYTSASSVASLGCLCVSVAISVSVWVSGALFCNVWVSSVWVSSVWVSGAWVSSVWVSGALVSGVWLNGWEELLVGLGHLSSSS